MFRKIVDFFKEFIYLDYSDLSIPKRNVKYFIQLQTKGNVYIQNGWYMTRDDFFRLLDKALLNYKR